MRDWNIQECEQMSNAELSKEKVMKYLEDKKEETIYKVLFVVSVLCVVIITIILFLRIGEVEFIYLIIIWIGIMLIFSVFAVPVFIFALRIIKFNRDFLLDNDVYVICGDKVAKMNSNNKKKRKPTIMNKKYFYGIDDLENVVIEEY